MKFIFVRHGETEYNRLNKRMGGRIDEPLNETGLKQAEELTRKLKDNFDIIISSPLKRAKKTSEIIAKKFNKEIVFSNYLKERDLGSLSGTVWKEGEKEKDSIEYNYHPYGGESVNDVKKRLQRFLEGTK